jgi:hypothetical protein
MANNALKREKWGQSPLSWNGENLEWDSDPTFLPLFSFSESLTMRFRQRRELFITPC